MSAEAPQALLEALALARAPRGPRPGPGDRLPDGVFLLLRIAAGEEQALLAARDRTQEATERLREAATFYLQQVLFEPNADSYRVLGVNPDEEDERLREHYRWLARWLHPDRNQNEWEAHYAERVNQAWQNVRNPERRQRYDEARAATEASEQAVERPTPMRTAPRSTAPAVDEIAINLRWLPKAIFGTLGVVAVLTVIAFSALHFAAPPEQRQVVEDEPAEEVPAALQAAQRMPEPVPAPAPAPAPVESMPTPAVAAVAEVAPPVAPSPPPASAPPPSAPPASAPKPAPATAPIAAAAPAVAFGGSAPVPAPVLTRKERLEQRRAEAAARRAAQLAAATPTPAAAAVPSAIAVSEPAAPTAAPVAAAVSVEMHKPEPAAGSGSVDQRTANSILGNFSQAYSDGNLDQMRAMFTRDATGPGGGLGSIMAGYSQVFRASAQRSLSVRDVSWFMTGSTLTIIASYEVSVSESRSSPPRRTHGDLRLDLRKQGDEWRIFRLKHDERSG